MLFLPLTPDRNIISLDQDPSDAIDLPIKDIVLLESMDWQKNKNSPIFHINQFRPEEIISFYFEKSNIRVSKNLNKKLADFAELITLSGPHGSQTQLNYYNGTANNEIYLPQILDEIVPEDLSAFDYHVYSHHMKSKEELDNLGETINRFNCDLDRIFLAIEDIVKTINIEHAKVKFDFLIDKDGYEIDWNYFLCHFKLDNQIESNIAYWLDYIVSSRDIYQYSSEQNALQSSLKELLFAPSLTQLQEAYILCELCNNTNSMDVVSVEGKSVCLTQDPSKAIAIFPSIFAAIKLAPKQYKDSPSPLFVAQYKNGSLQSLTNISKEIKQELISINDSLDYKKLIERVGSTLDKVLLESMMPEPLNNNKKDNTTLSPSTNNKKFKL